MSKEYSRLRLAGVTALAFMTIVFAMCETRTDVPYVAMFVIVAGWSILLVLTVRNEALGNAALLCASVMCGLAVVETSTYYVERSKSIVAMTIPEMWRQKSTDFGSMPSPNSAIEFSEYLDGRMIADVVYKFDANGLREIPATVQGRPHKVAFFGCSFMFGHGLENDHTLPFYFARDARGTYEGFSFAGEGWGPHQMLREIETGFVRRVAGAPDLAIYEAIPDHLRRVAGRAPWDDGPKYELCRGDDACYSGPLHSAAYATCRRWLRRSWTMKFVEEHLASLSRPSDIPLFLAVLKRTRSLLRQSGTRFVVVLWDGNELGKRLGETLRANQFDVVALSSIVRESDLNKHSLTQLDRHPSAETNEAIAAYLWDHLGDRSTRY